jgi:hypothetical protein
MAPSSLSTDYTRAFRGGPAGFVFLTPEGIVLDLNEVPLDDAQIRREEVVGKPLVEGPWWSSSPPSQAQLRAKIFERFYRVTDPKSRET